jgi:twitching motility protein PilJ
MGLLEVVAEASGGNLSVRAAMSEGALGNVADALNQLLESLGDLLNEVRTQIDRTNLAIDTISTAARRMEEGASSQASEVASATSLVGKITEESQRVSTSAEDAANAAQRAELTAAEGTQAVQSVIQGMNLLRSNVQAGAKKVKTLGDRSMEITSIVNTISKISEQTNMLALNAAIEAARAGENGRGFSVVAEEVRKLAERAAGATQEIDRLVKAIQAETSETVDAIEQQTRVVEEQSQFVARCGDALAKIREVATESATLVDEIRSVARAQVDGTTVVARTVNHVQEIAADTQRGAKGTVVTVEELLSLSQQLNKSVSRFKVA